MGIDTLLLTSHFIKSLSYFVIQAYNDIDSVDSNRQTTWSAVTKQDIESNDTGRDCRYIYISCENITPTIHLQS